MLMRILLPTKLLEFNGFLQVKDQNKQISLDNKD